MAGQLTEFGQTIRYRAHQPWTPKRICTALACAPAVGRALCAAMGNEFTFQVLRQF
jgi:hypothetical protein